MRARLVELLTRNWLIKLTALFLSVMLYIAVAAQQVTTQLFTLKLLLDVPPGRTLNSKVPTVDVRFSGRGSELLKLRALPPVIRRAVPDTFSGSVWTLRLEPSDVVKPRGVDVQIDEISPREIPIELSAVIRKEIRIVPRVGVATDSGYFLQGGLSITPSIARIVGSEQALAAIESVMTVPVQITGVTGFFSRMVPLDTSVLGVVRIAPKQVEVSGSVTAIVERSFAGIPVETGAGAPRTFTVTPARVSVSVRGPEDRVQLLTRDSLRVVAHLPRRPAPGAYARLTVLAPRGITARAIPDSVALRRRS